MISGFRASVKYYILLAILLAIIVVVGSACSGKPDRSHLETEVYIRLEKMGTSVAALENSLQKIIRMNRFASRKWLDNAKNQIIDASEILGQANREINTYKTFIRKNKARLKTAHLDHYIFVAGMLNADLTNKLSAMADYYKAMGAWLAFTSDNFDRLKAGSVSQRRSYDTLLIRANRHLQSYTLFHKKYKQTVQLHLAAHPAIVRPL